MAVAAAVAPVAASRRWRGAAGRRGLAVALFLGGLLALGLFCAGDADAAERSVTERPAAGGTVAEGADSLGRAADGTVREAAEEAAEPVREAVQAPTPQDPPAPQDPATGTVPDAPSDVRPAVTAVSGTVQDVAARAAGALPEPTAPQPGAPGAPVPALPGTLTPHPAPDAQDGSPAQAGQQRYAAPGTATDHPGTARAASRTAGAAAAHPAAYPWLVAYAQAAQDAPHTARARAAEPTGTGTGPTGPGHAPGSLPCGGTAPHTAADNGSPRGAGDQHAVTDRHGPDGVPVRGDALPATAAPTHDRPHDVLEFPG
ncbi:hypothetical protein [Streptomyces sp. TRM64462]|uniref:hypothetical protein n=1 Tax=Streptomyces sp. TRM64462 TaxID=2741726 RepID=UPI00158608C8|nr:hypothetical protein [Streptomyces sp. TRM64462]